jgi:signal recognition particle subunit SRP72
MIKLADWASLEGFLVKLLARNEFGHYAPGLVSLLVWIYKRNNNNQKALEFLERYSQKRKSHKEKLQIAQFQMLLNRFKEAAEHFKELLEFDNSSTELAASYLLCVAQSDPVHIDELIHTVRKHISLKQVDEESLFNVLLSKTNSKEDGKIMKRRKKKKKPLPKTFKPNRVPDPERWLPKQLRKGKSNIKQSDISGIGFQGVELEGGGIGTTGSARIAGLKPAVLKEVPPKEAAAQPSPPVIPAGLKKKSKKKKN